MSSGKEFRLQYWQYPLWKWELNYNYLKDNPSDLTAGFTYTDLSTIQGFFNQMAGRQQVFYFDDVNADEIPGFGAWDSVHTQGFGTGDGVATIFQLIRSTGGFTEAIQAPYTAPHPVVFDNGTPRNYGSDYSIDGTGNVIFVSPPAAAHALTWSGAYYWPVRFGDDSMDLEMMMSKLWRGRKVILQQVRL